MLNALIAWSLRNRVVVLAAAALLLATGLIIWLLTPLLIFGLPILAAKIAYYG